MELYGSFGPRCLRWNLEISIYPRQKVEFRKDLEKGWLQNLGIVKMLITWFHSYGIYLVVVHFWWYYCHCTLLFRCFAAFHVLSMQSSLSVITEHLLAPAQHNSVNFGHSVEIAPKGYPFKGIPGIQVTMRDYFAQTT